MKKIVKKLLLMGALVSLTTSWCHAQMKAEKPHVFICVEDSAYAMNPRTTQTENKRGWDIQGITLGVKTVKYLMGDHAAQITTATPSFIIYPQEEEFLNNYVLIRLKEKRGYRHLPKPTIPECDYKRIELPQFTIENLPKLGFKVTPKAPLFSGEWILVNMAQEPVGKTKDYVVFDFSVEED